MKIYDVQQGSGEWKRLRLGLPTASEFDSLVTPKFEPRTGKTPETYLYQKVCEKLLGFAPDPNTFAMEQGAILETEAKPFFSMTFDTEIKNVGFVTTDDGRIGSSPDGLIGDDEGLEIKCPQPHTHLRYLVEGVVPPEYLAQCHGGMFVTGRKRWKFLSYSRQFRPLVLTVERDERVQAILHSVLYGFLARFDAIYNRLKSEKDADASAQQADYDRTMAKMREKFGGELPGEKWLREQEEARQRAARSP